MNMNRMQTYLLHGNLSRVHCISYELCSRAAWKQRWHSCTHENELRCKFYDVLRAGLNEREVPCEVVTARPPKRLAQLRSISHTLVSTLQKHRSITSELGSLRFRNNVRQFGCG